MWLTDLLLKSKEEKNTECECLIVQMKNATQGINQVFSNKTIFIQPEDWARLNHKIKEITDIIDSTKLKSLRKTDHYEQLMDEITKINKLISDIQIKVKEHNDEIIKNQVNKVKSTIGLVEGKALDEQQLFCISKHTHNHLVLAGAGTGKTTTIVGLIKYLILSKQFTPEEILVLSFTNASASEMSDRIHAETKAPIEASTFHKLGLNILSKSNGVKPRITQIQLNHFINTTLKKLMQDRIYAKKMIYYCFRNRVSMKSEFEFKTLQEYQQYLIDNPPTTLRNEKVKSYGEMIIANYLFLNGIQYVYEQPYKIDTRSEKYGQYHPDFYLPEYDTYIEYFGIDKNGKPPAYFKPGYTDSIIWKRNLHTQNGTKMVECYAYENFDGILENKLSEKLSSQGIQLNPVDQEIIWNQLQNENRNILSLMIQLMQTIMTLMKSNRYDIQKMHELNHQRLNEKSVSDLLELIEPIWNRYQDTLKQNEEIDFNDMINMSTDVVLERKFINPYKIVIVDEYQDISKARYMLLKALRESCDFRLFCVGDDWQSIYRFAGSDISYIQQFSDYWGPSEISKIETTYRFSQQLIDISGSFVMKNPLQAKKQIRGKVQATRFPLGIIQGYNEKFAVQFMADHLNDLPSRSTVFFLGRYSFDIKMIENSGLFSLKYDNTKGIVVVNYPRRPDLNISYITAHKSKGLQADYIFILNNKNDRTGFPSKIEDHEILSLLLENYDTYPYAEERRLFYVALTRAKEKVVLVTIKDKESEFVTELRQRYAKEIENVGFTCPLCGGKLKKRQGKFGEFFGCENYKLTGCKYTRNIHKKQE